MGRLRRLRAVPEASPPDPTGEALRSAGRGDEQAFGDFYDLTAAMIYGVVSKIVRDPSMSEEVAQEVFVELWRLAPRYDPSRGSAKSWAATIAHRRAVDWVRSEQARRTRDDREHQRQERPTDTVADQVVDADQADFEHARLHRALDNLSEIQREAVTLAYYGGKTYREVATLLDLPEGTAKTRIRDGLARLRDNLEVDA